MAVQSQQSVFKLLQMVTASGHCVMYRTGNSPSEGRGLQVQVIIFKKVLSKCSLHMDME